MILDLVMKSLGSGEIKQIGNQLGTTPEQTSRAVSAALPLLLGALGRNSAQPEGAAALSRALNRDHDGSILDNLAGFLGQGTTAPGDSILKHVLGSGRERVESGLGQAAGLEGPAVSKLLALLAPVVMGALGKAQATRSVDPQSLSGVLREEAKQGAPQAQLDGLLSLLDTNQDGQVVDDIARIGSQLLGGLFGRK